MGFKYRTKLQSNPPEYLQTFLGIYAVGVMRITPPIWVHAVGNISAVILSCWFLYICVWGPGRDFAPPRKDYTPFASPFRFVVAFPLQSSTFCFATFIFYFFSFAMNFLSDAGEEGDWMNGSVYAGCIDRFALPDAMAFLVDQVSLATSYLSAAITRCLAFESSKTVLTW